VLMAKHEGVSGLELEDKWVLSRVHSLITVITAELEQHNYHRCIEELRVFIMDDFSRWYIRIIRGRSDDAVSDTLRQVLSALAKLLAPFAPYISDAIYFRLTGKSVHLSPWPKAEKTDEQLEHNMIIAREATQALLSAREKMHRTLRWPVKEALIVSSKPEVREAVEATKRIIANQANAKNVVAAAAFTKAKVRVKADYAKIGPLYGQATPAIIAQLSFVSSGHILKKLEETGSIAVSVNEKQYEMKKEHFITETEMPENYVSVPFSLGTVFIDTDMTREMEAEGTAREIVRRAQQARKDAGLDKSQHITAHLMTDKQTATALAGMLANIQERIGAKKLVISDGEPKERYTHTVSLSIKGVDVHIAFSLLK
jgi:isoleucyl-tRNA synthetase